MRAKISERRGGSAGRRSAQLGSSKSCLLMVAVMEVFHLFTLGLEGTLQLNFRSYSATRYNTATLLLYVAFF